jgi:hypothetical protein
VNRARAGDHEQTIVAALEDLLDDAARARDVRGLGVAVGNCCVASSEGGGSASSRAMWRSEIRVVIVESSEQRRDCIVRGHDRRAHGRFPSSSSF